MTRATHARRQPQYCTRTPARERRMWERASPLFRQTKTEQGAPCMRDRPWAMQPASKTADVKADYLEGVLWAKPSDEDTKNLHIPGELGKILMAPTDWLLQEPFTWEATRGGVARQKDNKAMRPYGIPR